MSVGENIKRLRTEKGLTQTELAEKSGITGAMLCQIERGTKNPSLQVAREIAVILSCRVEDFLN